MWLVSFNIYTSQIKQYLSAGLRQFVKVPPLEVPLAGTRVRLQGTDVILFGSLLRICFGILKESPVGIKLRLVVILISVDRFSLVSVVESLQIPALLSEKSQCTLGLHREFWW